MQYSLDLQVFLKLLRHVSYNILDEPVLAKLYQDSCKVLTDFV